MSRVCQICGKSPLGGHSISHSARKTNRRWLPNLQRVRVVNAGRHARLRVCTKCLKSLKVSKAA